MVTANVVVIEAMMASANAALMAWATEVVMAAPSAPHATSDGGNNWPKDLLVQPSYFICIFGHMPVVDSLFLYPIVIYVFQ